MLLLSKSNPLARRGHTASLRRRSRQGLRRLWTSIWVFDAGLADAISLAATSFLAEQLPPLIHFVAAPFKGLVAKCSFQTQTENFCIKEVIENRHLDRFSITSSLDYFSKLFFAADTFYRNGFCHISLCAEYNVLCDMLIMTKIEAEKLLKLNRQFIQMANTI